MKIINLIARNIKNLKAIEIKPDGKPVVLVGPNGAGKSAIMDAILTALTGKRFDQIIRNGEKEAEVVVDLGDYVVRKRFVADRATLEITTKEGFKAPSPQALLDKVVGKISFDPLSFGRMKPKEQAEQLKELAGLKLDDLEAQEKEAFDKRTMAKKANADLVAQLSGMSTPPEGMPTEPVSYDDAIERVNMLYKRREEFNKVTAARDQVAVNIQKLSDQIKQVEEQLASMKDKLAEGKQAFKEIVMPEFVSDEQIEDAAQAVKAVEEVNRSISEAKKYNEVKAKALASGVSVDALDVALELIRDQKKERIAAAKFPIPGLSVEGETVFYNGIPFDRLSTGQQIRVSVAIAMSLNPTLRVIFIREGSLLDDAGFNEIIEMAEAKDYDVFIEKVDDGICSGIHIENGEIVTKEGTAGKESPENAGKA